MKYRTTKVMIIYFKRTIKITMSSDNLYDDFLNGQKNLNMKVSKIVYIKDHRWHLGCFYTNFFRYVLHLDMKCREIDLCAILGDMICSIITQWYK